MSIRTPKTVIVGRLTGERHAAVQRPVLRIGERPQAPAWGGKGPSPMGYEELHSAIGSLCIDRYAEIQGVKAMLICRNIRINGRRTSLRMETDMWDALHDVARHRGVTPDVLVSEIERDRGNSSTTAALRVYMLRFYRTALSQVANSGVAARELQRLMACEPLAM